MSDVQSLLLYHAFFAKLWSPAAERNRVANENFAGLQQGAAQPGIMWLVVRNLKARMVPLMENMAGGLT